MQHPAHEIHVFLVPEYTINVGTRVLYYQRQTGQLFEHEPGDRIRFKIISIDNISTVFRDCTKSLIDQPGDKAFRVRNVPWRRVINSKERNVLRAIFPVLCGIGKINMDPILFFDARRIGNNRNAVTAFAKHACKPIGTRSSTALNRRIFTDKKNIHTNLFH